jgi:cyclic dehypoxanthinyl futalosine synthase
MREIDSEMEELLGKVREGERLDLPEAARLLSGDLRLLGPLANRIRREEAGERVTFVIDTNINYTNICISGCAFCAFYRGPGAEDAYVLTVEEVLEKIGTAVRLGATQVLLQGGLNPDLPLEYYEGLLQAMRERFPEVHRHAFSPPEIHFIAETTGNSLREVLERLRAAGLQSIPGGGAEILDDRVRTRISPRKVGWEGWRRVMVLAHRLGLPTTATMVFGLGETPEERARHLLRIREIQEETRGFTAFIPWSFQPTNTRLAREMGVEREAGGIEYLRTIAVSRILLSGAIRNLQASWVTQGERIAQVALLYGANDFGGTLIEENVVRAAGVESRYLSPERMVRLIRELGRPAAQRDTLYRILGEP